MLEFLKQQLTNDDELEKVPVLFYDVRFSHVLDTPEFRNAAEKVLPNLVVTSIGTASWSPATAPAIESKKQSCCQSNDNNDANANDCCNSSSQSKQSISTTPTTTDCKPSTPIDSDLMSVAGRVFKLPKKVFDNNDNNNDSSNEKKPTESWRSIVNDNFIPIFIGDEKSI